MRAVIRYSLMAWLLYTIFWVWLISGYIQIGPAIIRVMSIVSVEMALFYLNLIWFIPEILDKQKRGTYFLLITGVLLVAMIGGGFLDIMLDKDYPFILNKIHQRPTYTFFLGRFFISAMPLVVSALINRSMKVRKQQEESLELKNKMLEAETRALKAQINPHFLFNSLNNIYALAQIKSDKTPDAILHLSDILRFVTYDSNQDFVELKEEIKHIESFILLQALKDDDQSNIRIKIENTNGHYKIAPLLLIPFIENCFKHSNHEDKVKGWIDIELLALDGKIRLRCSNSCPEGKSGPKDKTGGVGLENVRKRLALIYPERYKLEVKAESGKYFADLEISLKADEVHTS